jgi:hypothetical protein
MRDEEDEEWGEGKETVRMEVDVTAKCTSNNSFFFSARQQGSKLEMDVWKSWMKFRKRAHSIVTREDETSGTIKHEYQYIVDAALTTSFLCVVFILG